MEQIAPQIYRWTAPHPEWRSSVEEVVSYALVDGETLAFVDPLLPAEGDPRRAPLLADIDQMIGAARRLDLFITIPYHTRSVETLYERYSRTVPTLIWGHPGVKKRLTRKAPFEVIPQSAAGAATEIADGAVLAYTIGKPRRAEYPLYFPGLRAVAFGDAAPSTCTEAGLRAAGGQPPARLSARRLRHSARAIRVSSTTTLAMAAKSTTRYPTSSSLVRSGLLTRIDEPMMSAETMSA